MTMIETTYVMRLDVLKRLHDAEMKTNKPKEYLVALCMRYMIADYKRYIRDTQRIEYQKRFDEETNLPIFKVRVKVRFLQREYNYFQDMRKFFSRSISLCIAIAVFNYLEGVVEELLRDERKVFEDNYLYDFYAIFEKCIGNATVFNICWGLPANIEFIFEH